MAGAARPRLVDVAQRAGVSVGTASDALAGKNRIPDDTRDRVRRAADELGYVPNRVARALQAGHLPLIGLVMTPLLERSRFDAYRSAWIETIGAATLAAAERGYGLTVLPGFAATKLETLPLAGLIALDAEADATEVQRAAELGIRTVTDNRTATATVHVRTDVAATVPAVMDHFRASGATRPAMTTTDVETTMTRGLVDAYTAWCATHGVEPLVARIDAAAPDASTQAEDALLEAGADALYITAPDRSTQIGRIAMRRERGLPRVLLALLDDDIDGRMASLGITTVRIGLGDVVRRSVTALIDALEADPAAATRIDGSFTLEVRDSSLPPRPWDGIERRRGNGSTAS